MKDIYWSNIIKITFTGADDKTSYEDLEKLHNQDIEFGILLGSDFAKLGELFNGKARYPSINWIENLPNGLNLSLHLCGQLVDNVLNKTTQINRNHTFFHKFQRVQLNLGKNRINDLDYNYLDDLCHKWGKEIILAGPFTDDYLFCLHSETQFLIDHSGGTGKHGGWFQPSCITQFGLAGGIGIDNILSVKKQAKLLGCDWIDMESKIRTNDVFDAVLCQQILDLFYNNKKFEEYETEQQISKSWINFNYYQ